MTPDGKTEKWTIFQPTVDKPLTEYQQIRFLPGDSVQLTATGCVQTGGKGLTWKRYVNPSGPNSDRLYYGTAWIPGVLGDSAASMRRFHDVSSAPYPVPAGFNTTQSYLRLGYLDNDYPDNGYTNPDPGTEGQCVNQPHATVVLTIVHGGAVIKPPNQTPLSFDLLSDQLDENLIPLNPYWGYQALHQGFPPSAEKLCAKTIESPSGGPPAIVYLPDQPPCTRQPTSRDDSWICGPHANWGPATVVGSIVWESHSTGTFSGDDDYSWYLTPPNGNGLTATRTTIEPEFKASETIDHFATPWWNNFHNAVDAGSPDPGFVNGKLAIVSGLFSLDFEHTIHSELHPVFAMAIRVKEDPADETWVLFVRRFGNEGFCSSHIHYLDYLPDNRFIFRLPLEWGSNATLTSQDINFTPDDPFVTFVPNQGVMVNFNMSQAPSARQLVSGEIHLHWANTTAVAPKPPVAISREQRPETLTPESEEYYQDLVERMTPAQKVQLSALVPHGLPTPRPTPKLNSTHSAAVIGSLPTHPAGTHRPSVSSVLDPDKVRNDQVLIEAIHKVAQLPPPVARKVPILP